MAKVRGGEEDTNQPNCTAQSQLRGISLFFGVFVDVACKQSTSRAIKSIQLDNGDDDRDRQEELLQYKGTVRDSCRNQSFR